jgi:uncharacterized protein YfaS (alpha-2-macroglobulin family)
MLTHTLMRISILMLALFAAAAPAQARGGPFFLLSDASYGPDEMALVRLEAQDVGAVTEYGGVDVHLYRVAKPLEFLEAQKNLHRIDVTGDYTGPGSLDNTLARVWDTWWNESRAMWRKLFSDDARKAVVAQAPDVKAHPHAHKRTPQQMNPVYRPLKGHKLVDSFRYPVARANPIQPPKGVQLMGSSSEFIQPQQGNVMIPLGRREPGLYLVEAMVGDHRANTLVFVSDSIAVTKVSAGQMLVWVAARKDGKPVAGAATVWTDGVGVLKRGSTDKRGLVTFTRETPEKTYVFGEDAKGGVFIGENHYYDSEIYNTKLYAVTDRPLYRPGDTVFVKFVGRDFKGARDSVPVAAGELKLQVLDPSGFPVANQTLKLTSDTGADMSFRLPDNAAAGGYELRFVHRGDAYGAAFRVADYQKPHFEINVLAERSDYKTGQEIKGRLQLAYPDGKPVASATTELLVRAQRLTMIEGDLGYTGQFPVKLTTTMLTTDAQGYAAFVLPAAAEPSRYVLTALATDGAAYRVRATKEILIERGAGTYTVSAARAFSAAGESVAFTIRPRPGSAIVPAAAWEWVRLEDRKRASGKLESGRFAVTFPSAGTYTVSLRDAPGNIIGATSHYVSGASAKAPQGSIQIVLDKAQYKPGETAQALITFPQPVDEALFTLERDRVEKTALMGSGERWVRTERVAPAQWRAQLPVTADYGPNITLSVVYVKDGEYVFQNQGLTIEQPRIAVSVTPDKAVYAPGDLVSLDFSALIDGNPAAGAQLTVSVVDEMIYVLQPEIAPDIFDFFYHPRRNNVRTSGSLSFIGYDLAKMPGIAGVPSRRQTHERGIKVMERPRREDKDTALWQPTLTADARGNAKVTFRMPDSLTRWRVTVRATEAKGVVGQSVAYVRSDKDFYVKWTSPTWLRAEDAPIASVAVFNQRNAEAAVELTATGAGLQRKETLKLKPGANFVALPLKASGAEGTVEVKLAAGGKTVDALEVALKVVPTQWSSARSVTVPLKGQRTALKLPADAANVRVQLSDSASAHFRRVLDDLIDYPYGCVEQTASRIIPYSLALQSVSANDAFAGQLTQKLTSHRFRLAQYAGPQATFGWWSVPNRENDDAFMTAYAYYADWYASRALELRMPPGHWDRLLEVYRRKGVHEPPWSRALMLYWMQEMNLPVGSLAQALADELAAQPTITAAAKPAAHSQLESVVLGDEKDMTLDDAMTRVVTAYVVQQTRGSVPPALAASLEPSSRTLRAARLPLADALLMLTGHLPAEEAPRVLGQVHAEAPTIDRALTMLWVRRALVSSTDGTNPLRTALGEAALDKPWRVETSATGQRVFRWPARNAPTVLRLAATPPPGAMAVIQYDSREPEKTKLPVNLERRLYRLKKLESPVPGPAQASDDRPRRGQTTPEFTSGAAAFALELLAPDAPLKTDEVYLDEIVLLPSLNKHVLRFGIVEVPLPPGATAERTTWGISVRYAGHDAADAMERARFEPMRGGYAIPVETLAGQTVIRHLVRVAQPGNYALPPARYYRMYEPELKAFEENTRARVLVR